MKRITFNIRSILYHRLLYGLAVLAAAVGTAVITGGLMVGDAVQGSLKDNALARLGPVACALDAHERYFTVGLADTFSRGTVAPVLRLDGAAGVPDRPRRVGGIDVYAADARFWSMAPDLKRIMLAGPDECVLNLALAERLKVGAGDTIILRVARPEALPGDLPLAPDAGKGLALRLTVAAVYPDCFPAGFSLRTSQLKPFNVFVDLAWLGAKLEFEGRVNVLCADRAAGAVDALAAGLDRAWSLADAGLALKVSGKEFSELTSDSLFMPAAVEEAAAAAGDGAVMIMSYFINRGIKGGRVSPYFFAAAPGSPLVPANIPADGIVLNTWMAEDLGARTGDRIELAYYTVGLRRELIERTAAFTVAGITAIEGQAADRGLVLPIPGLADAGTCSEWDPAIPIDLGLVRTKDEAYWASYKGTPKVFVPLGRARELWGNRFGRITAVRFPMARNPLENVAAALLARLRPAELGYRFELVRNQALEAAQGTTDFGMLFIGLGMFVVAAGLILTGLVFTFAVENRAADLTLMAALGFRRRTIMRMIMTEGLLLAAAGVLPGVLLGIAYNALILKALGSVWQGAVSAAGLTMHIRITTLAVGGLAGLGLTAAVTWNAARRALRPGPAVTAAASPRTGWRTAAGIVCLAAAFLIIAAAGPGRGPAAAAAFFMAGTAVLAGGLFLFDRYLLQNREGRPPSRANLARRNAARRRGRSMAVAALLAAGLFTVIAVAANRVEPVNDQHTRQSGTGGFALFGTVSIPFMEDLNAAEGRKHLGLRGGAWDDVAFVHLRLAPGDDASCLNLNKVARPALAGIDPEEFARRNAFVFTALEPGADAQNPWKVLGAVGSDGTIPAVADASVLTWLLKKGIGDTIAYTDEMGRPMIIRIAGILKDSVFQGSLLVDERVLMQRCPSVTGTAMFLADAPADRSPALMEELTTVLADRGGTVMPAAERLAAFVQVQNTYLAVFLVLGGLGVIVGSLGLGIVVLRNALERRPELALMRAVGYSRRSILQILMHEHLVLLTAGTGIGAAAGLAASLPALASPGMSLPTLPILLVLAAAFTNGTFWTWLAARAATRGDLLAPLRKE